MRIAYSLNRAATFTSFPCYDLSFHVLRSSFLVPRSSFVLITRAGNRKHRRPRENTESQRRRPRENTDRKYRQGGSIRSADRNHPPENTGVLPSILVGESSAISFPNLLISPHLMDPAWIYSAYPTHPISPIFLRYTSRKLSMTYPETITIILPRQFHLRSRIMARRHIKVSALVAPKPRIIDHIFELLKTSDRVQPVSSFRICKKRLYPFRSTRHLYKSTPNPHDPFISVLNSISDTVDTAPH